MADVVSAVLLLAGVLLAVVAALGLVRFPDVFGRMHAATKPATLGLLLVVLGASLRMDDRGDAVKLLLVAAFQFLTAPVAAHMVGRAAYRSGAGALDQLVVDELRDVPESHGERQHPDPADSAARFRLPGEGTSGAASTTDTERGPA